MLLLLPLRIATIADAVACQFFSPLLSFVFFFASPTSSPLFPPSSSPPPLRHPSLCMAIVDTNGIVIVAVPSLVNHDSA